MRPEILFSLFAPVTSLPGVGPKLATLVEKAAGPHVVDLLWATPAGLIDRRKRPTLAEAAPGEIATLDLTVDAHHPGASRTKPYRVIASDPTGFITLIFFHARADYLKKTLPEGARRIVSGKLESYAGGLQMPHPDYIADPDKPEDMPLLEPVYPLTAGLTAKVMRKAVAAAVDRAPELPEWQDPAYRARQAWPDWKTALANAHNPEAQSDLSAMTPARQRLAYDELLANQLALALVRARRKARPGRALSGDGALRAKGLSALPFPLTGAQDAALKEIYGDMAAASRMVRLLQGDVGSGKTAVAFLAALAAIEAGVQVALMVPTEILARQHMETLAPWCAAIGISTDVFTGRDKGPVRTEKLDRLAGGAVNLIVGTHALFQDDVAFSDLGLVIVDEQHRFGVHQRLALAEKGARADMLVMTATPIPRTLTLTAYGDMEVSKLTEKPPGRQPVDTRTVALGRLGDVVDAVGRAIRKGEQVYWVCPLVEESDVMDLTSAEDRSAHLKTMFGDKVGLAHGRMSAADKDAVMERFNAGDLSVLVATTVIEVGVNVPNATVIVIEHAERFGLAQLHQLRGRVGRGEKKSVCLLLYKGPLGETAKARLNALRQSEDGFFLAEEDLRLRGSGELLGAQQSGFPIFKTADIAVHGELLAAARDDAALIVSRDAELKTERGAALRLLLYLFERDDAIKLLRSG
ncbi:MAG: ATP-dependent DNA helicase RecG [Pseudomonadota bacterium]